jgi:hypothetical protein
MFVKIPACEREWVENGVKRKMPRANGGEQNGLSELSRA